jgi:hypothetical protein
MSYVLLRVVSLIARKFKIADFTKWLERFQLESGRSGLAGGLSITPLQMDT